MDRGILFKGKRIDSDGWVFGNHLYDNTFGKHYIVLSRHIIDSFTAVNPYGEFKRLHCTGIEVIPETIGQYTGLKDKDGKKIFEGDIVKIEDDDGNTNFSDGGIGDVVFYRGIWYVSGEVHNGLYDLERNYYVSVIGNIHDNPELLEAE